MNCSANAGDSAIVACSIRGVSPLARVISSALAPLLVFLTCTATIAPTFALADFLCYARARLSADQHVAGRQNTFSLLAQSLCLTLAVFIKESARVLAPIVVIHGSRL